MISKGPFPASGGGAASLGFLTTTAFDPHRVEELTPADGQLLSLQSNVALFALLGNAYGGRSSQSTYGLPDLGGVSAQYLTPDGSSSPLYGQSVGYPSNQVQLEPAQLPPSLGGLRIGVDNDQQSIGFQYLIKTDGLFPAGSSPTAGTMGMVYPFAGHVSGEAPTGFLPTDGRLLSINEYPTLYYVLGTTYGGDGVQTFALPDLRNRMPVGVGKAMVDGQSLFISLGEPFGAAPFILNQDQLPLNGEMATAPIKTMQPSLGMQYIVNTTGQYLVLDSSKAMLGQVSLYAGRYLPEGWVQALGQELPIKDNEVLFSLLGTTFGGNGTTTFALPDMQGRTAIGTGGEQNIQLGDTQGSFTHYLTTENLPEIVTPVPGVHLVDEDGNSIGTTVTGKFEVDISGVWPSATVQYSIDGGQTWSASFEAQEGSNSLLVRQVNVLGQPSQPTNPITFVLDTAAPEAPQVVIDGVSAAAPMLQETVRPAVPGDETIARTDTGKLSFGNVEEGAQLQFSIDGGRTWSDSFEAQAGLNAVQVRQVDTAGNVSPASELIQFHWNGSDTDPALTSTTAHTTGGNLITVDQHGALAVGLGTDAIDLLVHGHQQDITLPDDIEHIRLTEDGLNNTVTGNAQDNVFEVIEGNWVIAGNQGQDTVKLSNAMADYVITQESHEGQLQATLYGPEGRLIVRGLERIEFTDATLIRAEGADISQIDHLYEEVLGRMPDPEGLTYWVEQMNQGASLQDVAQALAESTEFKQLYGTPSDEQLVQEMYESILGRAPDAEGSSYWVEALVVHEATEGELIASLLLSAESQLASSNQVSGSGLFVVG